MDFLNQAKTTDAVKEKIEGSGKGEVGKGGQIYGDRRRLDLR